MLTDKWHLYQLWTDSPLAIASFRLAIFENRYDFTGFFNLSVAYKLLLFMYLIIDNNITIYVKITIM
jgi:hypothetical protein